MVLAALRLPLFGLMTIAFGDFLLVAAAAALIRRIRGTRHRWKTPPCCGFSSSSAVCCCRGRRHMVIAVANLTGLEFYLGNWANVALAHSLAYLLIVPTWISHVIAGRDGARTGSNLLRLATAFGMLLALWWSWTHLTDIPALRPLLIIAPVPILAWALIVFRTAGACYAMLAVGLLCMWVSVAARGLSCSRRCR